jgi:hypothetical protein
MDFAKGWWISEGSVTCKRPYLVNNFYRGSHNIYRIDSELLIIQILCRDKTKFCASLGSVDNNLTRN